MNTVTPQSGSIALPLQLITQHTSREKDLPQLPSTLGAQKMYQTHQELIRRKGNKPERATLNSLQVHLFGFNTEHSLGTSNSHKPMYHKLLLSTKWVDYVEEPMKYQALSLKFFSVGGWGGWWVGW